MAKAADERLSRIDALFRDFDRPDAPGATVMVIRDAKVLFAKSYGLADVEKKIPATPDTNYRLASVTKQFTAMVIMQLADRAKLSLDDPITKFFPEFPGYGNKITVRHLVNHTSGLWDYEELIPKGTPIPVLDIDALRLVMQRDKTYFPPGTQFRYSNTGFALLALIVEKVSGETFAAYLREHIFAPLHMNQTLAYEAGISIVPNRAFGYTQTAEGFKRTDQSLTSSVLGDGGVYSSIADLRKWDEALYSTKLVSRKMLKAAFTAGPNTKHGDGTVQYGFGWFISEYRGLRNIWHSGESIGFTTRIERFPDRKFTVIILTNRNDAKISDIPHRIADWYLFGNETSRK
ncbi:MAG TPA: serine hydrolase domain-containing protein [Verrucomicrobiae bacterium]|nr:serine hydrolase domain-containing protein [Verrucomicrobiae bacterium]